ncbi:hypothetical protein FOS14_19540 [Skermania sp. ID1734]|uniref:hypothetical protein n=1 Tax=Skermania sp. ID1734 TaxID=2597516 RepID=UPI001180C0DD|nr:hypothetical protein [Skermania sp. ID1734]TSD94837.1 hypothetical protein FOS14_19540 [Skermania sp. ID1734]
MPNQPSKYSDAQIEVAEQLLAVDQLLWQLEHHRTTFAYMRSDAEVESDRKECRESVETLRQRLRGLLAPQFATAFESPRPREGYLPVVAAVVGGVERDTLDEDAQAILQHFAREQFRRPAAMRLLLDATTPHPPGGHSGSDLPPAVPGMGPAQIDIDRRGGDIYIGF